MSDDYRDYWAAVNHSHASIGRAQDVNEVMLATTLAPDGFLVLLPPEDRD
jgi:hypothetical protein